MALTDTVTDARETWHAGPHQEAAYDRQQRWWQRWARIANTLCLGILLAAVVALALVRCVTGVA